MLRISTKTAIFIIPLLVFVFVKHVHGNVIQKVVYQEGATEDDEPYSSREEIPPREEWFRVRGRSLHQQRSMAVVHEARDIVALPSTKVPTRIIGNIPDQRGNSNIDAEHSINRQTVQVQVTNHGRVGFQKNHGMTSYPKRFQPGNEDDWELPRVPSRQGQQNRYHNNIRHESGSRGASDVDSIEDGMLNSQRQPESSIIELDEDYPPERLNRINDQGSQDEQVQLSQDDEDIFYEDSDELKPPANKTEKVIGIASNQRRTLPLKSTREYNDVDGAYNDPPPHDQVAKMARYIVRNSNWTSVATISTRSPIKGYPFVNIFSVSDGSENNSSGIPYMYLTPLDMSVTDLQSDTRASLTMSLAQSDYCKQQDYDPEDPRCAHVILSGQIVRVKSSDEIQYARNALNYKHPEMQDWPKDHGWFFAKLQIENIIVLDYFGGAKTATLDDYFNQSML